MKKTIEELGNDENSFLCLKNTASAIEEVLQNHGTTETIVQHHSLLKFVVEQIKLCQISKHARHYSLFLATTAFL